MNEVLLCVNVMSTPLLHEDGNSHKNAENKAETSLQLLKEYNRETKVEPEDRRFWLGVPDHFWWGKHLHKFQPLFAIGQGHRWCRPEQHQARPPRRKKTSGLVPFCLLNQGESDKKQQKYLRISQRPLKQKPEGFVALRLALLHPQLGTEPEGRCTILL